MWPDRKLDGFYKKKVPQADHSPLSTSSALALQYRMFLRITIVYSIYLFLCSLFNDVQRLTFMSLSALDRRSRFNANFDLEVVRQQASKERRRKSGVGRRYKMSSSNLKRAMLKQVR